MIISMFIVQSFLFFQDVIESVKIRTSLKSSERILCTNDLKRVTTSQNGIPVYLYTDLLILSNIPSRIPGSICGLFIDGTYGIFINESFIKESPSFQSSSISHEEGHIVLNHIDTNDLTIDEKDIAADIYSYQQGNDVITMLNTMKYHGYVVGHRIKSIQH